MNYEASGCEGRLTLGTPEIPMLALAQVEAPSLLYGSALATGPQGPPGRDGVDGKEGPQGPPGNPGDIVLPELSLIYENGLI